MSLFRSLLLGLLICTATVPAAHAQKLVPAYLVTASADTLRGELLQESTAKNSFQVKFKPQGNDITSYSASDIKAYGLGDSLRYESREVLVDEKSQTIFM